MIILIMCLIVSYLGWEIFRKVLFEPKATAATFAIIIFLAASLLFSYILTPTTHTVTKYGISELVKSIEKQDLKSNKEIVESLEKATIRYDTIVIDIIRYNDKKSNYYRRLYPKYALRRLVNRDKLFLK